MARVTVEDCLEKENNRFSLVILAAQRAKELLSGAKTRLLDSDNKQVVTALREIADGQVRFMTAEDIAKKRKREQEEREQALAAAKERTSISNLTISDHDNVQLDTPSNGNGITGNGSNGSRVNLSLDAEREDLFKDDEDDGEE